MAPERFMFSQPPLVFQVLSWASRPLLSWKWVVEIAGVHILPPVCRIKSLDHWCSNWWFGQRGNSGKQTNKPMNRWTCHCCFRVLEVDVGARYNQLQFFSWVQSDTLSTDFTLSKPGIKGENFDQNHQNTTTKNRKNSPNCRIAMFFRSHLPVCPVCPVCYDGPPCPVLSRCSGGIWRSVGLRLKGPTNMAETVGTSTLAEDGEIWHWRHVWSDLVFDDATSWCVESIDIFTVLSAEIHVLSRMWLLARISRRPKEPSKYSRNI